MSERPRGLAAAWAAFILWGLFPVYFSWLKDVPVLQVIAHRVVWSCLVLASVLAVRHEWTYLLAVLKNAAVMRRLALSALLISVNWSVYVWGVTHGHVVEASLGYFINPLVNVLLGVLVLSERLNPAQWLAVLLAATGVAYLTVMTGAVPWIALTVALTFGLYGLVRKIVAVEALPGLAAESLLMLPFAAGFLLWCQATGTGAFGHGGGWRTVLLLGCGPLSALPLFLFAYGARRIPYSLVGLIQYISPTLQLASGVLILHEPFERTRALGFALTWLALAVIATDSLLRGRR